MSLTKQLLICAVGLVLVRVVVQIFLQQIPNVDAVFVVLNQWMALAYFWTMHRYAFKGELA